MKRVSTLPGTWLLILGAVIPLLAAGVASAAPNYPVEPPAGTHFTVTYEPTENVLSLSTSTTLDELDGDTSGVDEATNDVSVVGPNGQMNHGQIVKQVHELAEGRQVGCITSAVARSDLGKGDQQVGPHDQPTPSDTPDPVDPSVLEVECTYSAASGKAPSTAGSEVRADGQDKAPGKPTDAPGRNK